MSLKSSDSSDAARARHDRSSARQPLARCIRRCRRGRHYHVRASPPRGYTLRGLVRGSARPRAPAADRELVTGPPPAAIPISIARTTKAVSHVTEETSSAGGVWLAALWGAGLLVCAVRIAMSYLCLVRIRRSATPAPHAGERVFESPFVATPITAGLWQPVVIIPDNLTRTLAPGDLEAVLAHERAHIARKDTLGNATQRVVESLLFFNPWVYLIGRQLVREREAACDDWAIRAESDPRRSATCLATLALRGPRIQTTLLTPSAVWPERMLVGRIARLLTERPFK